MISKTKLYGNNKVYSPSGHLLFLGNLKKINWYLDRDLASVIYSDDKYTHIKLNFEPDGLGRSKFGHDEYYLTIKENQCVVTGDKDVVELTKHHIVPYCFRRLFPLLYKSNCSHDIVLINKKEHEYYERYYADSFKDELGKKYGLGSRIEYSANIKKFNKPINLAFTIINKHKQIPLHKLLNNMIMFENMTNIKPTIWNLKKYVEENDRKKNEWTKEIVNKIEDYQEFVELWREHFINSMMPKYMPKGWKIDTKIGLYERV